MSEIQQHPSTPNSIHRHPGQPTTPIGMQQHPSTPRTSNNIYWDWVVLGLELGLGVEGKQSLGTKWYLTAKKEQQCKASTYSFCTTCVGCPQCNAIRPLSILVLVLVIVTITAIRALVWVALQYDGESKGHMQKPGTGRASLSPSLPSLPTCSAVRRWSGTRVNGTRSGTRVNGTQWNKGAVGAIIIIIIIIIIT